MEDVFFKRDNNFEKALPYYALSKGQPRVPPVDARESISKEVLRRQLRRTWSHRTVRTASSLSLTHSSAALQGCILRSRPKLFTIERKVRDDLFGVANLHVRSCGISNQFLKVVQIEVEIKLCKLLFWITSQRIVYGEFRLHSCYQSKNWLPLIHLVPDAERFVVEVWDGRPNRISGTVPGHEQSHKTVLKLS